MSLTQLQPPSPSAPSPSLSHLPSELLLHILTFLDIPDLLSLSRTSLLFRNLSTDPLLHIYRLHRASLTLSYSLSHRPSLADLMAHRIYITRTTLAARNLGRNLIKIKLNRQLLRRPSAEELVKLGVLPEECFKSGRKGGRVAPGLVETKRRVERERVKDLLRGWVGEWKKRGSERREGEEQKPYVRGMVRRFGREGGIPVRGGKREREAPPRAKVLGLRRFWEGVGRQGD